MNRRYEPQMPLLWMTLVAGLMAAPFFGLAQAPVPEAPASGAMLLSLAGDDGIPGTP